MVSTPIPEIPTWILRYENGEYFLDRHGEKSLVGFPRIMFENYPEQLFIIDRKLKLQKLLTE